MIVAKRERQRRMLHGLGTALFFFGVLGRSHRRVLQSPPLDMGGFEKCSAGVLWDNPRHHRGLPQRLRIRSLWEARTLWGAVVNRSRTFARQVLTTMSPAPTATSEEQAEVGAVQRELVLYQVAYVQALREQLRGLDPVPVVARALPEEDRAELARAKNLARTLEMRMSKMLVAARRRGWLDEWQWQAVDQSLASLMDSQGGMERIKNTPMPRQFDFFPRLFVQIYCLLLPVGMVPSLGWYTPLGSTLVGFMFLALEKIGRDLENPFENKIHDISMTKPACPHS